MYRDFYNNLHTTQESCERADRGYYIVNYTSNVLDGTLFSPSEELIITDNLIENLSKICNIIDKIEDNMERYASFGKHGYPINEHNIHLVMNDKNITIFIDKISDLIFDGIGEYSLLFLRSKIRLIENILLMDIHQLKR